MKDKTFFLNTILAVITGLLLLAVILVRVFMPIVMPPTVDIPDLAAISLAALVLDHYLAGRVKRRYGWIFLLAVLTFGLLPLAAGFAGIGTAWKFGAIGGIVFAAATWLFSSMQERMCSGPGSKAAPVVCAFGLYLASQCFAGMLF